jgi:WD40 repeat protein/DNA-binding winged helix-turn-helix (wHTH) protein
MIVFRSPSGRFCLDLRAGQLWKGDCGQEEIPLTARPLEVLCYLAERPGELISRDQLLKEVWGSDGTNVGDNSIDQAVYKIRLVIGDQAKPHKVIQTSSGRGFRFTAPIESAPGPQPVPRAPLSPYATVPPLPPTFFERPEISEPLREKVIGAGGIVGLTAVEGMGGVGKTLVTIGLCHDSQVRQAFPDGIVWLDIGKESGISFEERVKFIAHAMNAEFGEYTAAEYHSLLENKAVLIVLDDVWTLQDIEPFRISSGRSRMLYTSRDKTLAGPLGAETKDVDILDPEQARRFLNRWAGREKDPPPEPFATGILDQCKGLALALAMMGAALKGQPDSVWESILNDLKSARLKEVGKKPGGYAYQTLHAAIEVSVNSLPAEDKARYLKLAVLLEDMLFVPALLRQLWGGDERGIQRTVRLLADRGLARRDAEGIRVHDFQLDYVRGEHPFPDALALEQRALLLSTHVIQERPEELGSQLTGRLLLYQDNPGVAAFLEELETTIALPRLRPLWPALTLPGGPNTRILTGHKGWIYGVAIAADAKRAIFWSDDHALRVWNVEGHQPVRVLEGDTGGIIAAAITTDGNRAISGSDDGTLRVWDLESIQAPLVLESTTGRITAVAISANGNRAVASDDRTLLVWDLEGEQAPRMLKGHSDVVNAVAMTADGRYVISCSADQTLRLWDVESQHAPLEWVAQVPFHEAKFTITEIALTADGKRAIAISNYGAVLWDLESRQNLRVLWSRPGYVVTVAMSADGKRVIAGTGGPTLWVWDLERQQTPRMILKGHSDVVNAVAMSADGRYAISCSADQTLRLWDVEGQRPCEWWEAYIHNSGIRAVAISSDGKRAISCSNPGSDQGVLLWDLEDQQAARVLRGHHGYVNTVAMSADGTRAISGSDDGTLRVWDSKDWTRSRRVLLGHTGWITGVAMSADGKRAISCAEDDTLRVWDLRGHHTPYVLQSHIGRIDAVAISADGKRAISCSENCTLRVWDLEAYQVLRIFKDTSRSTAIAITADGGRAIIASEDCTLRLWELEGQRLPQVLKGHTDWITAVGISADGTRGISASDDHTLLVWNLEGRRCIERFTCESAVLTCAISDRRIMAGDAGGHLHLFAWEE